MADVTTSRLTALARRAATTTDADGTIRLVRAAQAGSGEAFEALVHLHSGVLFRFLVVRLGNEADARDALQETLVAAWRGLRSLRDPQSLRAWLLTLAVRQASSIRTEAQRRPTPVDATAEAVEPVSTIGLESALDALPAERRDVILLRYLVGLSETETAAALGVSVGTVKSRAARARQAIAIHLQRTEEHR